MCLEWLDKWNESVFYKIGTFGALGTGAAFIALGPSSLLPWTLAAPLCAYWLIGLEDLRQGRHAVRKNFPVLGRIRYLFESVRPEIRQCKTRIEHIAQNIDRRRFRRERFGSGSVQSGESQHCLCTCEGNAGHDTFRHQKGW